MQQASLDGVAVHDINRTLDTFEALYRDEPLPDLAADARRDVRRPARRVARRGSGLDAPAAAVPRAGGAHGHDRRSEDARPACAAASDDAYVDTPSIRDHARSRIRADLAGRADGSIRGCRARGTAARRRRARAGRLLGRVHRAPVRARHGLPVVHTMHNRVDVGIEATAPFPRLVLRVLNAWQRRALRAIAAARAAAATAGRTCGASPRCPARSPRRLRTSPAGSHEHGVVAADGSAVIDVWNGIDDDVLDAALAAGPTERAAGPAAFRLARPHEPREATAAVPRGARRVGHRRGRRGDRRGRTGEGGAPAGRAARAGGIRRLRRAVCRTPRPSAASPRRTPSCRPRSASRRRA